MEDDKKKPAIPQKPATDLTDKEAKQVMNELSVRDLLFDAMKELNDAMKANRPLVISYRVPCPCRKKNCTTKLAISITPYTEIYYDALRSKH